MPPNVQTQLAKIADEEARLGADDLRALSDLDGEQAASLEQLWPRLSVHRRREVMRRLAEISLSDLTVDFNIAALVGAGDEDHLVRLAAIDTLWDAENPSLIAPLLELAEKDPEFTVRAGATQVLGHFVLQGELGGIPQKQYMQLTERLLALFHNHGHAILVRCRALEALAAADRGEIPELIRDAYVSDEEALRISAVHAMGRTADTIWEPIILAELESINPSMRYQAARAAGQLELRSATALLVQMLEDPDPEVLVACIGSLGEIGDEEARPALEALCDDEEVGEAALTAVEMIDLALGIPSFLWHDLAVGDDEYQD